VCARINPNSMAGLAGELRSLCKVFAEIAKAVEAVQSFKQQSKSLGGRIAMVGAELEQRGQISAAATLHVKDYLSRVKAFLINFHTKQIIKKFVFYNRITAEFHSYNRDLDTLIKDLQFVAAATTNQTLLDEAARDDFIQQQVTNRQMMPARESIMVNKQLQLEAPVEFTGFLEIDFDVLQLGELLGEGTFGSVYQSKWNSKDVAVKTASCALDAKTIKLLRDEVRVQAQLAHDRIIALYGASTVAPHYAIVMEYAPLGSLHELLHSEEKQRARSKLAVLGRLQIIHDVATAMQYLHDMKVVDGDIKTANVVLFKDDRAKICDFGFAHINNSVLLASRRDAQSCGTPGYMAPEVLMGQSISSASDVYSFSMVL
jgi:predicted Ser/Thr protein kinase